MDWQRTLKPGRYAMHPSGRLYPARRARWFKPVAFVTLRKRDIKMARNRETPAAAGNITGVDAPAAPAPSPAPSPAPARAPKISLKHAPSAMEQLAASWKRRD
jgi:hypothetical protein